MASKGRNLAKLIVDTSGRQEDQVFAGDYIKVPVGTTAERPSGPSAGYVRFNTTTATLEQHDGSNWTSMAKPPIISTVSYSGSATAVEPDGGDTITISGTNFSTGVNVLFGTTYATSVTRTNSTSLSVTVPALSAADYDVTVVNNDGMQAILTDGLSVNGAPAFTTASGSLGNINNDVAITKITIVASEDDSGDISYTVTTGSLPTGLSIDSSGDSAGTISGTPTGYTSESTVNFTITATDDENQTTTRDFSLTVLVVFYNNEIDQSLRFSAADSTYLYNTPSSDGSRTTWTVSFWTKRLPNTADQVLWGARDGSEGSSDLIKFNYANNDTIQIVLQDGTGLNYRTAAYYRDPSSWYHIVWAIDTTQSTTSDRYKLYVNGEQITNWSYEGNQPSQNWTTRVNWTSATHFIGKSIHPQYPEPMDGYMAELHFIDGAQKQASDFGQAKEGVWIPKAYSGSYGTNGYYLDFSNTSNFGADQSGNGNNWSGNQNLAADHQVLDSPTNNFCTFDAINKGPNVSLGEGSLRFDWTSYGNYHQHAKGNILVRSGKWYAEFYKLTGRTDSEAVGIASALTMATKDGKQIVDNQETLGVYAYGANGNKQKNGSGSTSYGDAMSTGDIIGVALDMDNGKVTFYRNGTSQGDAYTDILSSNYGPDWTFAVSGYAGNGGTTSKFVANFGQDSTFAGNKTSGSSNASDGNSIGDFYYTPPSGYLALCNSNLSDSTTFELDTGAKPSDYFNTVLYTGNGSTQSITGVGFQPDFVWVKNRDGASDDHQVYDAVRGTGKLLKFNTNDAEATVTGGINSFDSDGFTTGGSGATNNSGSSIIAWNWKANGTPVSNTNGSITSSVSANTTAGFSVVSYTGTGSNATVGHGLSSTPKMVVIKNRSTSTRSWFVQLDGSVIDWLLGGTAAYNFRLVIDGTGSLTYDTGHFSANPTNSTFAVGTSGYTNTSGDNYIAYCWDSVPGFSKIGTFYGTGSSNGPFVWTGFKPAFIMWKNLDDTGGWIIHNNKSEPYNPNDSELSAHTTNAEGSGAAVDMLSNGFKLRGVDGLHTNTNADRFAYMAFAEDPFKYGNSR